MANTTQSPQATELKKPYGIYFMATMFFLAPLGNIIISFSGSGLSNWYEPHIFLALFKTIAPLDWLWLGMLSLTGILLFLQHKLSWTMAIIALVSVLGINAVRLFQADPSSIEPQFLKVFSLLAVLVTLGVLMIAFYFRFPYIDRRLKWTSMTQQNPDRRSSQRDKDRRRK